MAAQNGQPPEQTQEEETTQEQAQELRSSEPFLPGWDRPAVEIQMQQVSEEIYPMVFHKNPTTGDLSQKNDLILVAGGQGRARGAEQSSTYVEVFTPEELGYIADYFNQDWTTKWTGKSISTGWQPPILGHAETSQAYEMEDGTQTSGHAAQMETWTETTAQKLYYIGIIYRVVDAYNTSTWSMADPYAGPKNSVLSEDEMLYLGVLFGYPPSEEIGLEDVVSKAKTWAKDILTSDVENQIINPLIGYGRLKDKS
jgi:hypothetical protein